MSETARILRFYTRLTERQQEVACLVARGYSNAEVAQQLYIKPSVVAGHLTEIYTRLQKTLNTPERPNRVVLARMITLLMVEYPELLREPDPDTSRF